jgi:hypothetical protein
MPRVVPARTFILQRLRFIAANKKASAATQLRALDRIGVMEKIYEVNLRDQEPESGERPENLSGPSLDDTVEEMLNRAVKQAKRGGADADKVSDGRKSSS